MIEILEVNEGNLQSKDADERRPRVVVRGKFNDPELVTREVWWKVRKKLFGKSAVMNSYYDEEKNETIFRFSISTAVFNDDYLEKIQKCLNRRLRNGKPVNPRVLMSMTNKTIMKYLVVHVKDGKASVEADTLRFAQDIASEAINNFVDALMREFDGSTPEEMARDYVAVPLSSK